MSTMASFQILMKQVLSWLHWSTPAMHWLAVGNGGGELSQCYAVLR